MKHTNQLILALFLFPLFAIAQTNYKPGYVVTLKGDTIRGFINYKEWGRNPEGINFKSTLSEGPVESFTTKNASEFAVNGTEYFKRFTVRISRDQVELSNVKQGADTSSVTDAVFLRVLTLGKNVSLFGYTDKIKTRYYILDGTTGQPQELVYRVYYSAENATLLQTENRFRARLEYLAQKYNETDAELETRILRAQYQEADLVKIVQAINGNQDKELTTKKLIGKRWFAGLGVTSDKLAFVDENNVKFPNSNSTYPQISAGLDIFTNKNTQQVFLRAEMSLTADKHSISPGPATSSSYSISNLEQYTFSFSPQLVFNIYNKEALKVFVGAGPSINFSLYNNYSYIISYSSGLTVVQNRFPEFDELWITFPLTAGVAINNKIEISVNYRAATYLTNLNVPSAKVTAVQAGITYLFGIR